MHSSMIEGDSLQCPCEDNDVVGECIVDAPVTRQDDISAQLVRVDKPLGATVGSGLTIRQGLDNNDAIAIC